MTAAITALKAPPPQPIGDIDDLVLRLSMARGMDEVMAVVKRAVDVVAASSPRVGLVLKADIRPGHTGQLSEKVQRVEQHLAERGPR